MGYGFGVGGLVCSDYDLTAKIYERLHLCGNNAVETVGLETGVKEFDVRNIYLSSMMAVRGDVTPSWHGQFILTKVMVSVGAFMDDLVSCSVVFPQVVTSYVKASC